MSESQKSYRQIIKVTSLFGGVQLFTILISLIRSKIIAILLGPIGMGIAGLLNSTINLVGGFIKLGLDTSAVKEISAAQTSTDITKTSVIISSLNRLVWFTGIIAVILTMVFSPLLSQLAFGNSDYTLSFIFVAIALLFRQLTDGKIAILQGLRKFGFLAKSTLYGSFTGLIITIPLYYYFRIEAIVPAIIVSSLVGFLFSWFFTKKLNLETIKISNKRAFVEGKGMLKLGFMLSIMGLITLITAYFIQIFISHFGGVNDVGLYTAGFVIINSYVGMIFNAMQTDYFPKLSAIHDDIVKIRQSVTEQSLVAVLIVTPIIIVFLTTTPILVELLYSKEFLFITGMVSWGILATLFKAVSFSIGYVILAKGDSSLFIKTSIFFNSILFIFSIAGYYYGGLTGVGIGFLAYYFIHLIGLKFITFKKYKLYFNDGFLPVFFVCLAFCGLAFLMTFLENPSIKYSLMIGMSVISIIFTYYELNKKINIREFIKEIINKQRDKNQ